MLLRSEFVTVRSSFRFGPGWIVVGETVIVAFSVSGFWSLIIVGNDGFMIGDGFVLWVIYVGSTIGVVSASK